VNLLVTDAVLDGEAVDVRVDDGLIAAITPVGDRTGGRADGTSRDHGRLARSRATDPGPEVLDAGGLALVPGLVNGHTHAAMTLLRGHGSDLQLQEWLSLIWPAEARLTDDDVYWGTRLAALEMIRSGTVRAFDMYWHPAAVARAFTDAGLRAVVGAPLFDGNDPTGLPAIRATALESLDGLADCGPLIEPSITPHAPYTVSEPSLRFAAELAAERGIVLHIHLSETRREVDEWLATHDRRPAFSLDELGVLGPRTILAHGCQLDDAELELIAERGATIVTNPVSNLKLAGSDVFPYPRARAAGVSIGLGTDGASSNNSLDLLADLKTFALVQKHAALDPTVLPAAEALAVAQGRHSSLLGGRSIEVGAPADFLLVDTTRPEMNPGELTDNLVYAAHGDVVDSTVVAGRVLMAHRRIDGQADVIAEARRAAARIVGD
jgi:5-methylthioadenosine/S-adenosylhomocysteine deaminase